MSWLTGYGAEDSGKDEQTGELPEGSITHDAESSVDIKYICAFDACKSSCDIHGKFKSY